ncbi:MAG: aspartate aminotransferase family protein [Candidatus Odinarchaeota archaeon]
MFLKEELDNFRRKRPLSRELWEKSTRVLPGGISHNIRSFGLPSIGSYPVFIRLAHDACLVDVDGIEYDDFWIGHFSMILGHNHPEVQEIIREWPVNGWHYGTNTSYQVEMAETLIRDNPAVEKVRFCTSGTEATMYATRLARAFTGRRIVAKSRVGWHGANDTLGGMIGDKSALGLQNVEEAGILTFDVDEESTFDMLRAHGSNIAAVILEPVHGGGGGFPVDYGFLKRLREETEKLGILLIFDEIITGYRYTYGLLQNKIGVYPDLVTMGKIVGGGFPIGVVGGRADIVEQANPLSERPVWIGGGTFSEFPLSMAVGLKTLELLKGAKKEYQRINREGARILVELNKFLSDEKLPIVATGHESLIMLHVLTKHVENPTIRDIIALTDKKRESLLQLALFNRNILGVHGIGGLSMAHTDQQLARLKQAVEEIAIPVSKAEITQ